jgi:hypothetical protein
MPTGIGTYILKLVNLHIIYTPRLSFSNPAPGTMFHRVTMRSTQKRLRFMRSVTFTTYMEQRYKGNYFSRCFLISLFVQLLVFFHVSGPVMISSFIFSLQLFLRYFILSSELRLPFRTSVILRSYDVTTLFVIPNYFLYRKLSNITLKNRIPRLIAKALSHYV